MGHTGGLPENDSTVQRIKMNQVKKIILKRGKDEPLKRFHPWVFSGAILKTEGPLNEGDLVSVYSENGEFLALGHYQIGSIAVRIFSFSEIEPTPDFWKTKLETALSVRKSAGLLNDETNVSRLVHGEGDGLPGMIIDFYNGVAVLQFHSIGMYQLRNLFTNALHDLLGEKLTAVYDKSTKTLPFKAGLNPQDCYLTGKSLPVVICENGISFRVNPETGQKTGFFIDQRDNRKLLESFSKGREVLNLFSYTGGFSLYALRGGAKLVDAIDSSAQAVELERENGLLNFGQDPRHTVYVSDVADFMKNIDRKYDLMVIDPPAFSKHRDSLSKALQAYKRLNAKAIDSIRSGGILFTFSCSQVVSKEKFRETIFSAAALTGRNVRILHQLVQPADHPVNIYHPEGEYLKGLVLYVE